MTVSVVTTCVMPGVRFDVIEATERYVPAFFELMSYGIVTEPPAVGPVVWTWYWEPSAGAAAAFAPLEPRRFRAPVLARVRVAGAGVAGVGARSVGHRDILARGTGPGAA